MIKLTYPQFWQKRNILSYLLLPCSLIYFVLSKLRCYIAKEIVFSAKVICVGNISIGGTGKTPMVVYLAKLLKTHNIRFIILTKAYNSKLKTATVVSSNSTAPEVGDEAVLLSNYGTVVAAKKIKYAKELIDNLQPEVIIVDDGMQSPYFRKDFTLLMIDGSRGFGNELLIPAGPLRELPQSGIKKANVIMVVGQEFTLDPAYLNNRTIFHAKIEPVVNNFDQSKNYLAFCGIGNPEKFFASLKVLNLSVAAFEQFPDHHNYSNAEIEYLIKKANSNNASLITTEKDYIKLPKTLRVICLKIDIVIEDEIKFTEIILDIIK